MDSAMPVNVDVALASIFGLWIQPRRHRAKRLTHDSNFNVKDKIKLGLDGEGFW